MVLYVAGVLANGANLNRRVYAAVCNALGTTVGAYLLIRLIDMKGVEEVTESFPILGWQRSKELVDTYGFPGTILLSSMPIVLHPPVIFAVTAGMDRTLLILAVFLGRTIKYIVRARCGHLVLHALWSGVPLNPACWPAAQTMAQLAAVGAPSLRYFGYREEPATKAD